MKYLLLTMLVLSTSAYAAEQRDCGPNADQASNPLVPHFKCPKQRVLTTQCRKDKDGNDVCLTVETYE